MAIGVILLGYIYIYQQHHDEVSHSVLSFKKKNPNVIHVE